jgi:hypothetical protein
MPSGQLTAIRIDRTPRALSFPLLILDSAGERRYPGQPSRGPRLSGRLGRLLGAAAQDLRPRLHARPRTREPRIQWPRSRAADLTFAYSSPRPSAPRPHTHTRSHSLALARIPCHRGPDLSNPASSSSSCTRRLVPAAASDCPFPRVGRRSRRISA